MSQRIFAQQGERVFQVVRKRRIYFRISQRRVPRTCRENSQPFTARIMPRTEQNESRWHVERSVHGARHTSRIYVSCMRHDATARVNFLGSDGKAAVDLAKQYSSASGIKMAGNSGGANHGSLPVGLYCDSWLLT